MEKSQSNSSEDAPHNYPFLEHSDTISKVKKKAVKKETKTSTKNLKDKKTV